MFALSPLLAATVTGAARVAQHAQHAADSAAVAAGALDGASGVAAAPAAGAAGAANGFLPHGYCFLWNKPLLWTHVTSDLLIGIAYVTISFSLAWLVHRARRDIPFSLIFVAFGLFIIACGLTHFMEVWTFWEPVYRLSGAVKIVTAAASVSTAIAMPFMVPRVHGMILDARLARARELQAARAVSLEEHNAELARLNADLERAVADANAARRAAEQAKHTAEAANKAKSDFLAVMSHELRTPLNAIVGYTELVAMGTSGPVTAMQLSQLDRVRLSATHLVGLIDQVLSFARVEAGHDQVRLERLDGATIVHDAASLVEPLVAARGLALHVEVPESLPVRSDAQRLRQILLNLLSNAIKYTPAGSITVRATARVGDDGAPLVALSVVDTGIGLSAEQQARAFDPFWQAESPLTRTAGGAGLGLSVSRELAHALGGELRVESESGVGSTFTLVLPRD